jgi:IS605 OrfB family transposase
MRKAVRALVDQAIIACKPTAIEKLDFARKKAELRDLGAGKYARMLSALAFAQFKKAVITTAHRAGIRVIEVNPFCTSFMGAVRYAQRLGSDIHHAAAVEIARRSLRCSDRSTPYAGRTLVVPGRSCRVTFQAPVWTPEIHPRKWWGRCLSMYRRAHEAGVAMSRKRQRIDTATTPAIDASLAEEAQFLQGLIAAAS